MKNCPLRAKLLTWIRAGMWEVSSKKRLVFRPRLGSKGLNVLIQLKNASVRKRIGQPPETWKKESP